MSGAEPDRGSTDTGEKQKKTVQATDTDHTENRKKKPGITGIKNRSSGKTGEKIPGFLITVMVKQENNYVHNRGRN